MAVCRPSAKKGRGRREKGDVHGQARFLSIFSRAETGATPLKVSPAGRFCPVASDTWAGMGAWGKEGRGVCSGRESCRRGCDFGADNYQINEQSVVILWCGCDVPAEKYSKKTRKKRRKKQVLCTRGKREKERDEETEKENLTMSAHAPMERGPHLVHCDRRLPR